MPDNPQAEPYAEYVAAIETLKEARSSHSPSGRSQGENDMETTTDTTTQMPYTIRLAALDRAIDFLQHSHRTDAASADEVIASATRFEEYLKADGS